MRIALVTHHFYPRIGGIETAVSTLAYALRRRGHRVVVLTSSGAALESEDRDPAGNLVRRAITPQLSLKSLASKVEGFDVIHLHGIYRYFAMRLALVARGRLIVTPHSSFTGLSPVLGPGYWARKVVDRLFVPWLCERAEQLIALGVAERVALQRMGVPSRKISVIPNAVHVGPSSDGAGTARSGFLYLGRIDANKNVGLIILACARAGAPLRIVGDGDPTEMRGLRRLADGVSADVTFAGSAAPAKVRSILSEVEAIVFASHKEGQPMAALEAMTAGVPVVVPDGILEGYVVHGVTGYRYQPGNVDALERVIRRIATLGHCDERDDIVRNARDLVLERNDSRLIAAKHECEYEKCLSVS